MARELIASSVRSTIPRAIWVAKAFPARGKKLTGTHKYQTSIVHFAASVTLSLAATETEKVGKRTKFRTVVSALGNDSKKLPHKVPEAGTTVVFTQRLEECWIPKV